MPKTWHSFCWVHDDGRINRWPPTNGLSLAEKYRQMASMASPLSVPDPVVGHSFYVVPLFCHLCGADNTCKGLLLKNFLPGSFGCVAFAGKQVIIFCPQPDKGERFIISPCKKWQSKIDLKCTLQPWLQLSSQDYTFRMTFADYIMDNWLLYDNMKYSKSVLNARECSRWYNLTLAAVCTCRHNVTTIAVELDVAYIQQ